jgi:Ca2+-binding EF-hand superfamily protein
MASNNEVVQKFRSILLSRGAERINNLSLFFRQVDENRSKTLTLEELNQAVRDHNLDMSREETRKLFSIFDRDQSGSISLNEFLHSIRVRFFKIYSTGVAIKFWGRVSPPIPPIRTLECLFLAFSRF